MPAKDLGVKHTCFKCGTRFYDLKKPEPICPKCGADQRESPALRAPTAAEKRARPAPKQPAKEPVEELVDETDLEEELDEADEEPEETAEDEDT